LIAPRHADAAAAFDAERHAALLQPALALMPAFFASHHITLLPRVRFCACCHAAF